MANYDERYVFIADWYDPNAAMIRKYQFLFYPKDNTLEMFDIKNRRLFLKRSKYETLSLKQLYIGSVLNVYSRQLTLVDYGDQYTKSKLESLTSKTFAMIKPDAVKNMGNIMSIIQSEGFVLCRMQKVILSRSEAMEFYAEHRGKSFFEALIEFMTSGPIIAMELMREQAVEKWRSILGPTNTQKAKESAPESIRAMFGTDGTRNACHGSDSNESAQREINFFFGSKKRAGTCQLDNCTLCIIKPHAVAEGFVGEIISSIIDAGFDIGALQMFSLEKANAEEFYEIYKGVVSEYGAMVDELSSGACIAIEINHPDAPKMFREFVGPADPDIARSLRPKTLRARFGKDKLKNAIHCTDLPEDGVLEVEYFFKILDS